MKQVFERRKFGAGVMEVIDAANAILERFSAEGYELTLRQLYYQFVSSQPISVEFKNEERSYKRLGSIINDARMAGLIDWDQIVDRTRNVSVPPAWDSPADIIASAAHSYQVDLWEGQKYYVEAWVEKDALIGVLEHACEPFRLPTFSCRGYTSQSEMYAAAQRLARKCKGGRKPVVLHFGDHDPSGVDMSRDIRDRLETFLRRGLELRRLALTMEQVEELNPPPNPAKITDSRANAYIEQYGGESWELDALPPQYIDRLVVEAMDELLDAKLFASHKETEEAEKATLERCSSKWDRISEVLEGEE